MTRTNLQHTLTSLLLARDQLKRGAFAQNTILGYRYDFAMFSSFCKSIGLESLPATPETVSLYLTALLEANRKVSTARRRKSAIAFHHRQAGHASPVTPEICALLNSAQRLRRERPRQVRPVTVEQLRKLSRLLLKDRTPAAAQERAILLLGFSSALRRSNLAALTMEDLEFTDEGLVLLVSAEKNNQKGEGRYIGIPNGSRALTCPVRAMRAWLKLRGKEPGPVFRPLTGKERPLNPVAVSKIVKRGIERIGGDGSRFGAHSLRAGLVTAAGEAGASELLIAAQTGHRSMSVLRSYFRRTNLFKGNAAAKTGL